MSEERAKNASAGKRQRLDQVLVERGLCETRNKAHALIIAGQVVVGDQRIDKPGTRVASDAEIRIKQQARYVSRGGEKLSSALRTLSLDPHGRICLDVGASTGGFTDCLLQSNATKVYAVDVGHGLLAHKLQSDPRVVVMDKTNARQLQPEHFADPIDWVVVDASFIGMEHLAPALARVLPRGGTLLAMIKPQFEVGAEAARRNKGVIKDEQLRQQAIAGASRALVDAGFEVHAGCDSAVHGPKGNVEYFVHATRT